MRGTGVPGRRRLPLARATSILAIAGLAMLLQLPAGATALAAQSKPSPRPHPATTPAPNSTAVGPTLHGARSPKNPNQVGNAHLTPKRGAHGSASTQSGLNCAPGQACTNLSNHGGMVMHSVTAFLIFWLPSGSAAPSSQFERLITRYFYDAGSTPYFGLLGQYCDSNGCPANS